MSHLENPSPKKNTIAKRYLPTSLSPRDKSLQSKYLRKSQKLYRLQTPKYYTRNKLASFHSRPSPHVANAKRIYKVDHISANNELARKTGCSVDTLARIINKGAGAYYSSGSRPNQTAQSWGRARLASALTAGKAAAVDYHILHEGCRSKSKAMRYANRARKMYGHGTRRVPKVRLS